MLARFFGIIKHYNKGRPLNQRLKEDIEEFFEYKWENDKN